MARLDTHKNYFSFLFVDMVQDAYIKKVIKMFKKDPCAPQIIFSVCHTKKVRIRVRKKAD